MMQPTQPIGVFDSGIGGLSILKALRSQLPHERFVYFADTAHNPYGQKSEAFIIERSLAITQQLIDENGIKLLVVACNTATAAAIGVLRQRYPQLPIVGVEPALKPAAQISRTKRVGVLATRGTLQSAKFAALRESLNAQAEFVCVPCDGLAECIEHLADLPADPGITTKLIALTAYFLPAIGQFGQKNGEIDTLVLGCTHYPLVRERFAHLVGSQVTIVDNAKPVALRCEQLLRDAVLGHTAQNGGSLTEPVVWRSSADVQALQHTANHWRVV